MAAHQRALAEAFGCNGKSCPEFPQACASEDDEEVMTASEEKPLRWLKKLRKSQLFDLEEALERSGCAIGFVADRARIPVIKFVHTASGLDCDLVLENYDGYLNSQLLRAYAEFDDRARALGMAIKHWAKQRRINDTVTSHLSSYSFVLLTVYFLQTKAKLLPNLQDAELRRQANVKPIMVNGVDVSFCADRDEARAFHLAQHPKQPTQSLGDLLLSFFQFYSEEFNFSDLVVCVRCPEEIVSKKACWGGKKKLKPRCFSIQDPIDVKRDLGGMVKVPIQKNMLVEFRRALALLREGDSFETRVCEASDGKKKKKKQTTSVPVIQTSEDGAGQDDPSAVEQSAITASPCSPTFPLTEEM